MDNLKKIVHKNPSTSIKNSYIDACSNKDFKKYIDSLYLEDELLMKYTSTLQDAFKEQKSCANCLAFSECSHSLKGHIITPELKDKRLVFTYIPCAKYKNYISLNKNVTYFEVSREIKNASFKKLYKDDKKRLPIIKYFNEFMKEISAGNNYKGLYLNGSFGSGKTYLISALFNELSKNGIKSTIIYYPEFLRILKASFKDDYEEKFDFVKKSQILLIDDIGAENCSGWNRDEVLSPILQYRMEEGLPTFFTSNFDLTELENHLSVTSNGTEKVKARRIIERIKQLTNNISLITENRRN